MSRVPVLRDWVVLVVLAVLWGISFVLIKKAVAVFSHVQTAFWRVSISSLIYVPIVIAYWSKINWRRWKPLIVVALAGSAVPSLLFAVAALLD